MTAELSVDGETRDDGFADELAPGTTLLHGQYTIESFLNAGGFGVTYLARDSLERLVVLKECFPSAMCCRTDGAVRARNKARQKEFDAVVRHFGQEARRLSTLSHPNIVGIHQVFEDRGTAFMALDFVRGRELLEIIEDPKIELSPTQIKKILVKLLSAVKYIHDNNVLHRDISPDNILIEANGNPVLIDFGAAREEASRQSRVLSQMHVVKDGYSPQEFYLSGSKQNWSSDLYSLAATFYHLISGDPPPTSQERVAAIAADREDPYRPLSSRNTLPFDVHFLSAIDHALNPFLEDRLESADAWMDVIDTPRRQKIALAKAHKDKQMEASIQALVAATNSGDAALDEPAPRKGLASLVPGTKREASPPPEQPPAVKKKAVSRPLMGDAPEAMAPGVQDSGSIRPRRRSLLGRLVPWGRSRPTTKQQFDRNQ